MACVIIPSLQMVTLKLRQGSDLSKPSLGQYWVLNSLLRTSSLQVHLLWVSFSDVTSHTLCLFKKFVWMHQVLVATHKIFFAT